MTIDWKMFVPNMWW